MLIGQIIQLSFTVNVTEENISEKLCNLVSENLLTFNNDKAESPSIGYHAYQTLLRIHRLKKACIMRSSKTCA